MAALALYLALGSPGTPDQPYRARLAAWRAADPATLSPERMAAVLQAIAAERPRDPQVFDYLGRAEMAAGDPAAAVRAFGRAARLRPAQGAYAAEAGEAMVAASDGKVTPAARDAFARALALDPRDAAARYYLARARIAGGDAAGGLADWRTLAGDLPAADPRRPALLAEIDRVATGGAGALAVGAGPLAEAAPQAGPEAGGPPTGAQAAVIAGAAPAQQAVFIRGMVASLAARLAAAPDDPAGWARLVRAYGVLGDRAAQADALARARRVFAGRPDALAMVEGR